ncbi:MAG: phosphoglycerate dehydrogenase [Rickettsiales bacterium]
MAKVLISDKMSPRARDIFLAEGVDVDVKTGLSEDELCKIIGEYDGLAIRSSTKVTGKILDAAVNLKVIGRAGIGVDNVDVPAATNKGVIVMNTPFGNSVTTAEHAIALMMSLARSIPVASASTHAGKWEKNRFIGVEVAHKTLGLIGCGNIGSKVAKRAQGLEMEVIVYDPYLSAEHAAELHIEKVSLDDLLAKADFISLHTPLTAETRNILGEKNLAKTKKGVRIVNCARGGLVDEAALRKAIDEGRVAGAALDVFSEEPATDNVLFGCEDVICTPHLGASTAEAQENVALQVAEQISAYLNHGTINNAVNIPSLSAEDAAKLKPYLTLGEQLGAMLGQIADGAPEAITIEYDGEVCDANTKPVTATIVRGVLSRSCEDVNIVNALSMAQQRNVSVSDVSHRRRRNYRSVISVTIKADGKEYGVAGTLFRSSPRILELNGTRLEAAPGKHMLYVNNKDKPGFIGRLGTLLGEAQVNIANFHLGRGERAGNAIALVESDVALTEATANAVAALPDVITAKCINL